jgi:anti-anti-sigma factor
VTTQTKSDVALGTFELLERGAGPARVVVEGVLDHTNVADFRSVADQACDDRAVVLDLERCVDIDAAGIGALIRCIRRVHEHGGRVVVTTMQRSPIALRLRHSGVSRLASVIVRVS